MSYGSSFFRVARRLCLAAWLCAVAVSVKAAVGTSGGSGPGGTTYIYVPLNDCPAHSKTVFVSGSYAVYALNGNLVNSGPIGNIVNSAGVAINLDQGTAYGVPLADVGDPITNISRVTLSVNVTPYNGSGAVSESYQETWYNSINPISSGCGLPGLYTAGQVPEGGPDPYYSSANPACQNSQPGCYASSGNNIIPGIGYTNNTATPQQITWDGPNGSTTATLLPGQSTNLTIVWPVGNGSTGGFQVSNQGQTDGGFGENGYQNFYSVTNATGTQANGVVTNLGIGTFQTFTNPPSSSENNLLNGQGGLIWNSTNTAPAQNATLEGGFQLLNNDELANQNAQNGDFSNLLAALTNRSNPLPVQIEGTNNFSGTNNSGTASNVWVQNWPTNFGNGGGSNVWVRNFPTNIDTNTALGLVWGNTNQAANYVQGISQQAGTLEGMVPGSLADNNGSAQQQDIIITPSGAQQQVTIAMGVLPSTLSTTFSQIRGLIGWFVVVFLAIWNFKSMFDTIKDVSMVPQGQGPDTGAWAALGSNIVTALVVASAIVAVISVIPVFAVGLLAGELSFASNYSGSSPLNFFNQMGWGFQFLSQYLPIYLMFTAFGVRVLFYFGLEVLAIFACFVIKLLIGV